MQDPDGLQVMSLRADNSSGQERLKTCSGRDELCNSVLNDEWASHPTWASEDSGFIAHRKNIHEEGLHRIEEERHDYDSNIEAAERTIQLLEPLAQQLQMMPEPDRAAYVLPPGIGGSSESIYKKVIKKLYGKEYSQAVIESLFAQPYNVVPTLLMRIKERVEDWKASQREWEKVWREQTQKMFWKSLDHQGIHAKNADKRQFQTKTLQNEIQVKFEEQKRQRQVSRIPVPKYQFEYVFDDEDVIMDASYLLLTHAEQGQAQDYPRLTAFIKEFIPLFFGLDTERFQQRMKDVLDAPAPEADGDELPGPDGAALSRSRKINGKKTDLLRGVLDRARNGNAMRKEFDESAMSSRASSPDPSGITEDEPRATVETEGENSESVSEEPTTWLTYPVGNLPTSKNPNELFPREVYNLYCNLPIYCFFRMFVILYERLLNLKDHEDEVHEAVRRAKAPKPALDLKMVDRVPSDFFADISSNANYYHQCLIMFEEQIRGQVEMSQIEETLRRFYLSMGWQLYALDRMLSALVRFAISVLSNDGKDRSWEILQLFKRDRVKTETTHQDELNYRKAVEKCTKDGDIYRVTYVSECA